MYLRRGRQGGESLDFGVVVLLLEAHVDVHRCFEYR